VAETIAVSSTTIEGNDEVSFVDSSINLQLLQKRLSSVMRKEIPLDHVIKYSILYLSNIQLRLAKNSALL
jgi:hypothetical protein